jgi:predicted HTH transcriptional regulator
MLYVERNEKGEIVAVRRQEPGEKDGEKLSLLNAEVLAFLSQSDSEVNKSLEQILSLSDESIIRVLEDLIDLLIKKNIILFTELPEEAQEKIRGRKHARQMISSDSLMIDDGDVL